MLRATFFVAAAFALTAAGCRTTPPEAAVPGPRVDQDTRRPPPDGRVLRPGAGDPLVLVLGQTDERHGRSIHFREIVEDSRCPLDVECVWTGRARVALFIDDTRVELTVPYPGQPVDEPSMIELGMIAVEAQGLDPYPGTSEARARAPRTLHLVTRRAGS